MLNWWLKFSLFMCVVSSRYVRHDEKQCGGIQGGIAGFYVFIILNLSVNWWLIFNPIGRAINTSPDVYYSP